jgi:hypothetical protein
MNGSQYLKFLQQELPAFSENSPLHSRQGMWTQLAGAPPHYLTREWFLVGPVETSPDILLVYRVHLVMIPHKISATDMLCKGAGNLLISNVQFKFQPPRARG